VSTCRYKLSKWTNSEISGSAAWAGVYNDIWKKRNIPPKVTLKHNPWFRKYFGTMALIMEAVSTSETSVYFKRTIRHCNPEVCHQM
jgi:hypothetical protein